MSDQPEALQTPQPEPVAWLVTTEMQDGTRRTYPMTGRLKDAKDACDFGDPAPLYTAPPQRQHDEIVRLKAERDALLAEVERLKGVNYDLAGQLMVLRATKQMQAAIDAAKEEK